MVVYYVIVVGAVMCCQDIINKICVPRFIKKVLG